MKKMRLLSMLLTLCLMLSFVTVGAVSVSADERVQGAIAIDWSAPDWGAGGNTWGMKDASSWGYDPAGGVYITAANALADDNARKIGIPTWGCGGNMKSASQNTDGMMAKVRVDSAAVNGEAVDTLTISVGANIGAGDIWYNFDAPVGEEFLLDIPFSSFADPAGAKAAGMMWNEIRVPIGSTLTMWLDDVYTYTLPEDEGGDDTPAATVSGTPFFNWDYYGQGWGSTVSTTNLGNKVVRIKSTAGEFVDQFQFGSGGANNEWWGMSRPQDVTTLDGATGFVFTIRVNNLEYSDASAITAAQYNFKIMLKDGAGTASITSSVPIGQDTTVAIPLKNLSLGDGKLSDDQIATLSTIVDQVEFDFMTPHWGWRRYGNLDVVMSSVYAYTGEGTVTGPALPAPADEATFDCGVGSVEIDADGNVTMPEATVDGKQFIGWKDAEGKLHKVGAKVAAAEGASFTGVAAAIELQTGAGIRWAELETERGIRFETTVSKDALDAIGSSSFELGALILPYANYNADITVDTAASYNAINVVDPKVYGTVGDNYRYYSGVVDFERYFAVSGAVLADLKLTAVSYVKVTYADGTSEYFYDMPDATNNVRTVAEVARAAMADTEFGYTDEQLAILDLYAEQSSEDTVPKYRKDDADKIQ